MANVTVGIRVEENMKKEFEKFCNDTGLTMSTAVNMFIVKTVQERRIPFEIGTGKSNISD